MTSKLVSRNDVAESPHEHEVEDYTACYQPPVVTDHRSSPCLNPTPNAGDLPMVRSVFTTSPYGLPYKSTTTLLYGSQLGLGRNTLINRLQRENSQALKVIVVIAHAYVVFVVIVALEAVIDLICRDPALAKRLAVA